jgi:hypothetical protein
MAKFDQQDALVFGAAALAIGLIAIFENQRSSLNVVESNPTTTSAQLAEAESYNQDAAAVAIAQAEYGAGSGSGVRTGPSSPGHTGV